MIVFDTETTGFIKPVKAPLDQQPHMIELGAIKVDEEFNIIDEFSELFDCPIKLPENITDITGISAEDLKGKRTISEAYLDIEKFFWGENLVIGHNVMFDWSVLECNFTRISCWENFYKPKRLLCTVNESYFLEGYRLKLEALYEKATGEKIKGWHRAISDAKSTLECYKWLRTNHGVI